MFNRYAKVSADGVYTAAPKKLSKFKYISMMVARVSIVDIAYSTLAQAVTVAVRFSAVRRASSWASRIGIRRMAPIG